MMSGGVRRPLLLLVSFLSTSAAFHDCVQPRSLWRAPGALRGEGGRTSSNCSGGLCLGMHGGPHEGGPASYAVGHASTGFTSLFSTMTVPGLPRKQDGICYYLWTDIFFGDMSQGRMNQFVPQLILGDALDGSSGPPHYNPHYGDHSTWAFAAHYFFEIFDAPSNSTVAKAAYGELHAASAGELLFTNFSASPAADGSPIWTLTMGIVNDPLRVSVLKIDKPYMGLGENWAAPSKSWGELNYTNMCINACWEIYGGSDEDHLPSTGARYNLTITRGTQQLYPWVQQWDQDEGARCINNTILESHSAEVQTVLWDIGQP